jgi:predicted nucleic acid-binding protein
MNLVDTSAWLEFFTGGKNAAHFQPAITDTRKLLIPTIVLYEVFKKLLKEQSEGAALEYIGHMTTGNIADLDMEISLLAGKISKERRLAMADSIILATAQKHSATVWTQDADFKDIPGVKYFPKK